MKRLVWLAVMAVGTNFALVDTGSALAAGSGASAVGQFGAPFQPPGANCAKDSHGVIQCLPAAATMVTLANGRVLYWNALEGTENVIASAVLEGAAATVNDKSKVLDLSGGTPTWINPAPIDGGANPNGYPSDYLIPQLGSHPGAAYGDLFCSDQVQLSNGTVLSAGGTDYYNDPGIPGTKLGVIELEGLKNARIFDPSTNNWSQTGSMNFGRWYPSLVTLPNGNVFVASGVHKLIKPIYPNQPVTDSGRNVTETETYSLATGTWTTNPASADYSLPLFARLHLLPDGHVYFDAAGQTFNPAGYGYDELLWNFDASFDPATNKWTQLGIPGIGTAFPGFRGSSFSQMLPLTPNAEGQYTKASFLSAGGVYGVSPGTYFATNTSEINTVDTASGDKVTTLATGNLNNKRWYSTGVPLPDGTVMAFSGSSADEVVGPGTGFPVEQAEQFNPATNSWTAMASASHGRTYHNTAALLDDGTVLVGGHAPIPTLYGNDTTLPGGFSSANRDPSFEIYKPPYLFWGPQPVITAAPPQVSNSGGTFVITTPDAANITKVMLMRNTSITHLVDGDQRSIVLPIVGRDGNALTVQAPPNGSVAPPGPYRLFIDKQATQGLIPSVAAQVFVGHTAPSWAHSASVASFHAQSAGVAAAGSLSALPLTSVGGSPIGMALIAIAGGLVAAFGLGGFVRRRRLVG